MLSDFSLLQWALVFLIFVWSGLVRSGLGFGGAAFSLPLMLMLVDDPLLWLPMVACHLLLFSTLTVMRTPSVVDWGTIRSTLPVMLVPKMLGVLGLVSLPADIMTTLIYAITLAYGFTYALNIAVASHSRVVDNVLLLMGGYASGVSLIGAPLITAVYTRRVAIERLRATLFAMWIILVSIKMATFVWFGVDLQLRYALLTLPAVAIGHWLGLAVHNALVKNDGERYRRLLGMLLIAICGYGLVANLLRFVSPPT